MKPTTRQVLSRYARMVRSGVLRYPGELTRSVAEAHGVELGGSPGAGSDASPGRLDPAEVGRAASARVAAAWIGHATVLLRVGGAWVLTDPVLSRRIGVSIGPYTLGLGRLRAPAAGEGELPPIDLILISHAHYDHLDKPTLRRLARAGTRVVTAAGTGGLVPRGFGQVDELAWGKEVEAAGLRVSALRPDHWGARRALDRTRGYNAYVIASAEGGANGAGEVLFAGDTADTRAFAGVLRGSRDLAVFGIGGYEPWAHAHATPESVWRMFGESGAAHLLPMHHSTFRQSDEPVDEPLRRLLAAAGEETARVVGREVGSVWVG